MDFLRLNAIFEYKKQMWYSIKDITNSFIAGEAHKYYEKSQDHRHENRQLP